MNANLHLLLNSQHTYFAFTYTLSPHIGGTLWLMSGECGHCLTSPGTRRDPGKGGDNREEEGGGQQQQGKE